MRFFIRFALTSLALLDAARTVHASASGNGDSEDCIVQDDGTVICNEAEFDYYDHFDDDDDEFDDEEETLNADARTDPLCVDSDERCSFWASAGECGNNPNYMMNNCRKSCNNCEGSRYEKERRRKLRETEEKALLEQVAKYGEAQVVSGSDRDITIFVVKKTIDYMENYVFAEKPTHRMSVEIIEQCMNKHELCAFWAAIGECEENISFMQTKCAPSCQSCSSIDFDNRCPKRAQGAIPGLRPGELNTMFERIVNTAPGNQTEETQLLAAEKKVQENGTPFYTVTVHSRPESPAAVPDENGVIALDPAKDRLEKPWVITFDNFLTDEECDHLIQLGYKEGYQRSKDVGKKLADGSFDAVESQKRTSENAWCSGKNGCREDPIAKRVMDRIGNVVQVPTQNFEDFQMLRYEVGQFYGTHHDYIGHQKDRACGPRILTFFLYLSDVEEGGGTGLDKINGGLVVNPKKGRALLWPSVMNHDPSLKEHRTTHEAQKVIKGTKFAANSWIHLYDVVETQRRGCT